MRFNSISTDQEIQGIHRIQSDLFIPIRFCLLGSYSPEESFISSNLNTINFVPIETEICNKMKM